MQKPDSNRSDALGHGGLATTQSGAPDSVPEKLFADSYPPASLAEPMETTPSAEYAIKHPGSTQEQAPTQETKVEGAPESDWREYPSSMSSDQPSAEHRDTTKPLSQWDQYIADYIQQNGGYTTDHYEEALRDAAQHGKQVVLVFDSAKNGLLLQSTANGAQNADAVYIYADTSKLDPESPLGKYAALVINADGNRERDKRAAIVECSVDQDADGTLHPHSAHYIDSLHSDDWSTFVQGINAHNAEIRANITDNGGYTQDQYDEALRHAAAEHEKVLLVVGSGNDPQILKSTANAIKNGKAVIYADADQLDESSELGQYAEKLLSNGRAAAVEFNVNSDDSGVLTFNHLQYADLRNLSAQQSDGNESDFLYLDNPYSADVGCPRY